VPNLVHRKTKNEKRKQGRRPGTDDGIFCSPVPSPPSPVLSQNRKPPPPGYPLYYGFSLIAGLLGWPYFYYHLRSRGQGTSFLPRLGLRLPRIAPDSGGPRIWLHGVSVGEISGAEPLIKELQAQLPQARWFISTGTETGQALAHRLYGETATVFYYPLDLPWAVARYLSLIRPNLYVALETEIWPNFLRQAHQQGITLALLNGRLSDRSFRRYLRYKYYLMELINYFSLIAAGGPEDAARFQLLGYAPEKLAVTGNTKWDRQIKPQDDQRVLEVKEFLRCQGGVVFLAASTHPGEEEGVIQAYQNLRVDHPTLLLIIVPRHPERAPVVGKLLGEAGVGFHYWQRLRKREEIRMQPAVVVDTIGELFSLYGVADLVFVGGSLVAHGGQNILEPAAWGKLSLYGPHMENFRLACALLEEVAGGEMVPDVPGLIKAGRYLLDHEQERLARGRQGQEALRRHQGAAHNQARLIVELIRKKTGGRIAGTEDL
jgi:3-deoxy-D-manno-octulosonic-acid transferase